MNIDLISPTFTLYLITEINWEPGVDILIGNLEPKSPFIFCVKSHVFAIFLIERIFLRSFVTKGELLHSKKPSLLVTLCVL